MEEYVKKAVMISVICGLILLILLVTTLVARRLKKKKLIELPNINLKSLPIFKSVPVNVQLTPQTSTQEASEESDISGEFSQLKEKRAEVIDPLLGVLYTSQLTRIRLQKDPSIIKNIVTIEIALVWARNDKSLTVMIPNVEDLVVKGSNTFVLLRIESSDKVDKDSLKFEEKKEIVENRGLIYCLKDINLKEAQCCYLRFDVSEKKNKLSKENICSRGFISLRKTVLVPNSPLNLTVQLTLLDKSRKSREENFGILWVGLKCCFVGQISAKFLLEIKRAENLAISKTSTESRVETFLLKKDKRIQYFNSGLKNGNSPEWNSNFTFDISINNISDYSLEFMIIKIGKLSGIKRIGKTSLSNISIRSNVLYWEDAIENIGEELMFKRDLKASDNQETIPFIKGNIMGFLLVGLTQTEFPTSRKKKCKFEVSLKNLAYFEFEKSGGDYKLEVLLQEKEKILNTFTSEAVTSDEMVWNARFTLPLNDNKVDDISVVVTLIRVGRIKKSTKIGRLNVDKTLFDECAEIGGASVEHWIPLLKI